MSTFLKHLPKGPPLRDLYTRPLCYGTAPSGARWSDDGSSLAFLWNEHGEPLLDLYVIEGAEPKRITDAASVPPLPTEDDPRPAEEIEYAEAMATGIGEFDWLGKDLVFLLRGNLFVTSADGRTARRATTSNQGWSNLQAAPDGKRVAFLFHSNLWTYDVQEGALKQITFFAKEDVAVVAYGWSPDSARFWVVVEDTSMYERVKMPDYSPQEEVKILELRRNNAGKALSKVRVGIVPSTGGKIARVKLEVEGTESGKNETGDEIVSHGTCWTWDCRHLIVAYADGTHRDFRIAAVKPGEEDRPRTILHDRRDPWAEWSSPLSTPDSKHICFLSYRDGWRRVYKMSVDGGEPEPLTPTGIDVSAIHMPKRGSSVVYSAFGPCPTEVRAFSVPLVGGEPVALPSLGSSCEPVVSSDGRRTAIVASSVMRPAELYLLDGDRPGPITHSPTPLFAKVLPPRVERMTFLNEEDGATIHAKVILPTHFDPAKRYPVVLTCVYAGQAKEGFGRYQVLDTYMANEMGYILVGIDLRASMGYGSDFHFGYYKKLGLIDAGECVSCAKHLRTLPYVDPERIGLWGGSYGGFLTLMALCDHPGVFHTGVAWKPVTDWRNYWDGYICERLGSPKDDPEVYRKTSPVFHAEGLQDNLLIIHGMLDDNVLFQDAAWMVQKLIEAGKYFDLMIYPRDDHMLGLRHESLPDCMERIAAYFEEHMGLGPMD